MSDKGKLVAFRPVQFVQTPTPPAPYESFDQMDIVTLRDYIRSTNLLHGYLPTMIHKTTAVALCNGTMQPADVAEWEWKKIAKKRGMMTDGKLRQWVRRHTPEVLAIVGEGVDQILNPESEKETDDTMANNTPGSTNLLAFLNRINGSNGNGAPNATPPVQAPAPAPAPVQVVPTLNIPAELPKPEPEEKRVAPVATRETATVVDIRQHPKWETLAKIANTLEIPVEEFIAAQMDAYAAALHMINDREARIKYLHTNLPRFVEAVFSEPNVPSN